MRIHRAPTAALVRLAVISALTWSSPTAVQAQVDPDGGSFTAQPNSQNNVVTFTVTNNTGGPDWITFMCTPNGAVTWCSAPTGQNVGPGLSVDVEVVFHVGASGTGTVYFEATGMEFFTWDDGWYDVTIAAFPQISILPDGGSTSASQNSSNNAATFTVTETGGGTGVQVSFTCTPDGTRVTACTPPGSVWVPAGQFTNVTVYYNTGPPGSGTLTFNGQGGGSSDQGSFNVTVTDVVAPDPSLMLPIGDVTVEFPTIKIGWCDNYSLNAGSRWIKVNGVDRTASFGYDTNDGPACTAKAASTSNTVSLNLGSNPVEARICDNGGNCTTETYSITRRDAVVPAIALLSATTVYTEFPSIQLQWCDNESLNSASWWIKVNGIDRTASFNYVTGGSGCTVRATSTTSTVSLALGNNSVEARICDNWSNCSQQTFTIFRANANAPVVALVNHNRDNQDRSYCLTAAAGDAGAVQCGDLLAFHAMPALRSMGQDRSLTLVYNSATAEPRPTVAVQVTIPSGVQQPTDIYAELTQNSTIRASATYAAWAPEATRNMALAFDASGFATGMYPFTLLVRSNYPGAVYDAVINDTLIVVNRETSEFGAGWHPAGVERLLLSQPGGSILWVGGDGSAKMYRSIGGGQWQAPAGAFRDLIVQVGGTYERRGKHGITVTFDNVGRHISTRNRLGHVTTFTWDANGRLTQIKVPGPGGE